MLLFIGITILASPKLASAYCDYAEQLLVTCVENMKIIYDSGMIVYDVHGLVHLAGDVKRFGVLDNFSSFPFENELRLLQKKIRKPTSVLQQLAPRLEEERTNSSSVSRSKRASAVLSKEHLQGPVPNTWLGAKQYAKLQWDNYVLTTGLGDNCIQKHNGQPCVIRNILSLNNNVSIVVQPYMNFCNFFESPLPSSCLNIFKVWQLADKYEVVQLEHVKYKCVCIPYESGACVVIPLPHML